MPYAVQLDLDAGTNAALDALADFIGRVGGIETVRSLGDVHHLSLAVYDTLEVAPFAAELERFAESLGVVPVALAGLGVFVQQGVLYFAPVVSESLLALHRRFHDAFAEWSKDCREHYHPSHWVPHVTLAMETEGGSGGGLEQALSIVRRHWRPGAARLDAVRLDRFYPVETLLLRELGRGAA